MISVLFSGPLFWTSNDVCPRFQSQDGAPRLRALSSVCVNNNILRISTYGVGRLAFNYVSLYEHVNHSKAHVLKNNQHYNSLMN